MSGSGATVKGKRPYVMIFLEYYQQRRTTTVNVPEISTSTEVSFTDPDETKTGSAEQFNGESTSHDQAMEGGSSFAAGRTYKRREKDKN